MTEESLYSGAIGIPTASPALSVMCPFARSILQAVSTTTIIRSRTTTDRHHECRPHENTSLCGSFVSDSAPAVDAGDAYGKLNNGINDLNCEDLPGPVKVGANDEDQLDADGNGWGCD